MSLVSYLILAVCFGSFRYTSSIPNITRCQRYDKVCFMNSVNDIYQAVIQGDPALGIKSSDPLDQESVEANLSIVKYSLTNSTCTGFSQCKISNAEFSRKTTKLHLEFQCPQFRMSGNYEIDIKLIMLPIQGRGPYWIECKNYFIKFDADADLTKDDDGKTYISIKNFNFKADLRGGMDFDLANLFNGQKELADRVLQFARDNWKPVSNLLQEPTFNANFMTIVKNFNKFMKHVPLENIVAQ